jgi:hypothetical protein
MVIWLWKWFIGWAYGFGILVLPADVPLVWGLVWEKLIAQEEEEELTLKSISFFSVPLFYQSTHKFSIAPCLPIWHRINHRLNVIERKRWVRPYLGCYLGLVDDDRRGVLEHEPLSCHLITQVEELIQIGVVGLERLAILPVKVLKVGLMMLFLSRLDLLTSESHFFMLEGWEVVDSLVESPKCVGTWIEQESKASIRNSRN